MNDNYATNSTIIILDETVPRYTDKRVSLCLYTQNWLKKFAY